VEVYIAPGGYRFAGKAIYWLVIWDHGGVRKLEFLISGPIEDINRAALINKDFLNGIILDFDSDDHGVILLVVEAVEWVMWLMDCIRRRCLFLAEEVEPPLAKPPEMVLMVPRKEGSAGVMSVRSGSRC